MFIACNNCHKKFDVDSNLIPDKGRLLQCNACSHEWFFKKETINEPITPIKIEKEETIELLDNTPKSEIDTDDKLHEKEETIELLDNTPYLEIDTEDKIHENDTKIFKEKKSIKDLFAKTKKRKNYKILNSLLVTLISFVAFIIILDTFKTPISETVPNIELLLYNFYETLHDLTLFFKDLF